MGECGWWRYTVGRGYSGEVFGEVNVQYSCNIGIRIKRAVVNS